MDDIIKAILAFFVTLGAFLFGDLDGLMFALLGCIVVDYITGVMVAIASKKLSSAIGAKGILKKVLMLLIVVVANLIDVYVIGGGAHYLKTITIIFYISNEAISILENGGRLGVPFPKKLLDVLAQLKKSSDEGDNKDD